MFGLDPDIFCEKIALSSRAMTLTPYKSIKINRNFSR